MNLRKPLTNFLFILSLCLLSAIPAMADSSGFGPGYTGWHQAADGRWTYLTEGSLVKDQWLEIGGKNYCFDAEGYYVEGSENVAAEATTGQAQEIAVPPAGSFVQEQYIGRANPYPQYPDLVEVDIANQHVFCYVNNVLMWDSYCVTGCVEKGTETPVGTFSIQSKERERYLMGPKDASGNPKWKNWVDYWMPFHDGCGLHDASWRDKFAGTIYQYAGSHGCVNLPQDRTPYLYNLVYVGMPVVVHP